MGLNQYLHATIRLPQYDKLRPEYQTPENKKLGDARQAVINAIGIQPATDGEFGIFTFPGTVTVTMQAAYWRRSNQIHGWFCRQYAADNNAVLDNCERMRVSRGQLGQLVQLCEDLLKDKDPAKAAESLPLQEGFLFGPREIGDWYWTDLEDTVKTLKPWAESQLDGDTISFEYHGWW